MRWAFLLALLSTSALASRADRLSVSPRLDRRDRLGAAASSPILLSLSLLPPDSECSGTPPDGVTFARASAATCIDSSGVAHALTTDEARVHGTLGLLVEAGATNAVLHSRDVTAAAWTGTGCAATATGMDGVSLVGRCTGATSVSQTLTVDTGTRTASAYVRHESSACTVTLSADSESTSKPLLGGWERLTLTYTSDGSVALGVSINSGCVADIDYVQDEAGSIATSPIVTGGTAAVRAIETAISPLPERFSEQRGCSVLTISPLWTGAFPLGAYYLSGGYNNNRLGYSNAASDIFSAYGGAGSGPSSVAAGFVMLEPRTYLTRWDLDGNVIQVHNVTDAVDGPMNPFAGFSSSFVGIYIGSYVTQGPARRADSYLRDLVIGRTPEACQ